MTTNNPQKEPQQILSLKFNPQKLKDSKIFENKVPLKLYVNAFPLTFKKDFLIHEYPFTIEPEINNENIISRIFRDLSHDIQENYGHFNYSGKIIYAIKEILLPKDFQCKIVDKGEINYILKIDKKVKTSIIKEGQKSNFSQNHQNIIYKVIRDILTTNPNVKFDRDNLYLENNPVKIVGKGQTYFVHDGYKLSLKETEVGLCLIIGIKNKIIGDLSVYDAINDKKYNYGEDIDERIENLIGKRFVPNNSSKSKIIFDINRDKTPKNTNRNHEGKSYTFCEFFEKVLNKKITDENQPMIEVKVKGPEGEEKFDYYVPEFCKLSGLNENDTQNYIFMKELAQLTKLLPDENIGKINKCLALFEDNSEEDKKEIKKEDNKEEVKPIKKGKKKKKKKKKNKDKEEKKEREEKEDEKEEDKEEEKDEEKEGKKEEEKNENKINIIQNKDLYNTPKKKRLFYGIELNKIDNLLSYYISTPTFHTEKVKDVQINSIFSVSRENINTENWLCIYHYELEDYTYELSDYFDSCKKSLGIRLKTSKIGSNWIRMESNNSKDWKQIIKDEMKKKDIKFVIFFLSKKNNYLYNDLKKISSCDEGYISQVIKYESFKKAKDQGKGRISSYISKILIQLNCKLGGACYLLNLDKIILDTKIMFIGIDFGLNASHTWQKREKGVMTMVATKDKYYSKFYSINEIIDCKKDYILSIQENISHFIDVAIKKYEKEEKGNTPKNIIFYRQGISEYQTDNIKSEIKIIEEICNLKKINYYYVIVNTNTSYKFFEFNMKKTQKENGDYKNPEPGLINFDKITDINKFEFYLQPQKVTQGSAKPSYFHAIYGNMNYPELLMKLTYWTTYIYPNWQNAIRIPHVLKIAEKYSSMTAQITRKKYHKNLEDLLPGL